MLSLDLLVYLVPFGLVAVIFMFAVLPQHPRLSFFLILVSYTLPFTFVAPALPDTRPTALVGTVGLTLHYFKYRSADSPKVSWAGKRLLWTYLLFGIASLASVAWSTDEATTLASASAWLFVLPAALVSIKCMERDVITRLVGQYLGLVLSCSALALVGIPGQAFYAGRARGILDNPNGLAIFCSFFGILVLSRNSRRVRALWPLSAALVVMSGSRAGTACLLAGSAIVLLMHVSRSARPLFAILSAAAIWALSGPALDSVATVSSGTLLRTNNSRTANWSQGLAQWQEHPWLGSGAGAIGAASANSYLKVVGEAWSGGWNRRTFDHHGAVRRVAP